MSKRILLVTMMAVLATATACSSGLTRGDRASDEAHAFLLHSAQIIDKLDGDTPGEGNAFLIIKYEVDNPRSQRDAQRQWNEQMVLASGEDFFDPVPLESLDNELWQTTLAAGESRTGYIAYAVPDEVGDFKLTLTFPVSGTESIYEFRPMDIRISANAGFTLSRLEQIERTRGIPLIGGLLASFTSSPIRYLGTILVPEEEIDQLLEDTEALSEDARLAAIEDYLLLHGHGKLE
jgi:hypothetical protein